MSPQTNQPNMAAYQNFNQPMQIGNPYIDRMAQLQQYQQSLQPAQMPAMSQQPQGLIGKVVNDVSMVSPNDVPMDGNVALFPKSDMSEIYCKQWKQDGTIQTVVYRPYIEQDKEQIANIPQNDFTALNEDMKALRTEIVERFDRLEKSWGNVESNRINFKTANSQNQSNYRNNAKPKKTEVVADE